MREETIRDLKTIAVIIALIVGVRYTYTFFQDRSPEHKRNVCISQAAQNAQSLLQYQVDAARCSVRYQ